MFFAYWTHNLPPFLGPHWGNFGIRYYGLSYVLGFFAGAWLLARYARAGRSLLPAGKIADCMVMIVFGVMLGGRLGSFLLYHPDELLAHPLHFFLFWEGGMASHGGMIGVAVAVWWYSRSTKIPFLHLGDLIASTAPAGLMFGRIANFINGELWGRVTTVPWAVFFPQSPPDASGHILPRHPSQLYEAALEGALLLAFMQWRFWRGREVREHPGRLAGEFLLAYAVVRAIGEMFREPDPAGLIFGLSRGTFYSIFLVIGGLVLVVRKTAPLALSSARKP